MSNWTEVVDCLEEVKEHILTTLEQYGYQQEAASDLIYMRDAIDKVLFDKDGKPKGAPLIDAGALAEKIFYYTKDHYIKKKKLIQLITSSRDLNITWKDNETKWGVFTLTIEYDLHSEATGCGWFWSLKINGVQIDSNYCKIKSLAEQASEKALRSIVSGVKS